MKKILAALVLGASSLCFAQEQVDDVRRKAEQGDAAAQVELGVMLHR